MSYYSGYRQVSHGTTEYVSSIGMALLEIPPWRERREGTINAYLATVLTALLFLMCFTIYLVVSRPSAPQRRGVEGESNLRTAYVQVVPPTTGEGDRLYS